MYVLMFPCFDLIRSQRHIHCWWKTAHMFLFMVLIQQIWSLLRRIPYKWWMRITFLPSLYNWQAWSSNNYSSTYFSSLRIYYVSDTNKKRHNKKRSTRFQFHLYVRKVELHFSAGKLQLTWLRYKTAHSEGNIGGNITHPNAFWWHGIPINEEREWGGN
jgi:hypothetical protein